MILINEQIFIDLSHLTSNENLKTLDREINIGLAKAQDIYYSIGSEYSRGDAALDLYNKNYKDVKIASDDLREWEIQELKNMNLKEQQKYLKFAKGAYFPWAVCYSFLNDFDWNRKMVTHNKYLNPEAKRLFPKTIEWCYNLPIFDSIGRICIFGIDPCQHVTCHRDMAPEKWSVDDEFIMVSPRGDKKFYLYDEKAQKKHFVNSKVFLFHDLNYHGVEPSPHFTYNFRIDGHFTEEFKKTLHVKRVR